jgi:hypothetical protein
MVGHARFENAFSIPGCTPTRAMILTGLYPNRSGFMECLDSPLDPENNNRLPVHLKPLDRYSRKQVTKLPLLANGTWGGFKNTPINRHPTDLTSIVYGSRIRMARGAVDTMLRITGRRANMSSRVKTYLGPIITQTS